MASRSADDRRVLRWFIIGVQGALIFSVVFVENFLPEGGSANNASEQAVIVFAIALLTLTMLVVAMRFDLAPLSQAIRKVTELTEVSEPEGAPSYDVGSFNSVFKGGQMYREAGLTIAQLAKKLNLPEYRLRAFIHRELGFRNFNAMLHAYRVEEASLALADADQQSVPVLTIALSVGYQPITPFNNAFREIMGVTPSSIKSSKRVDGVRWIFTKAVGYSCPEGKALIPTCHNNTQIPLLGSQTFSLPKGVGQRSLRLCSDSD